MTNEPQNRSEEWLKAYAQQRRAEAASHELHPATRRLLQAEVARTHARPAVAAVESAPVEGVGLFGRWSFNALAISAVGVVAAVIGVLVSDSQQPRHAKFAGSPKSVSESEIVKTDRFPAPMEKPAATAAASADKTMTSLPFANTAAPTPPSTTAPAPQLNSITSAGGGGSAGGAPSDLAKASAPMKSVLANPRPSETASSVSSANASRPGGIQSRAVKMTAGRSASGELGAISSGKLEGLQKEGGTKANAINEGVNAETTVAAAKRAELRGAMAASSLGGPGQAGLAAPGASEKTKKADADAQSGLYLQQNFSQAAVREQQAYRRNLNAPGEPRVLVNFQLEREGDTVRVVDGDGSVYSGNVVVELGRKITPDVRRKEAKEEPVKRDELGRDRTVQLGIEQSQSKAPAEAFNFQVIGTNRSLRQRVSFEGNYQMPGLPASELKRAGGKDAAGNQPYFDGIKQQQFSPAPTPRVQGRAVIGNNRIEVDAVPVSK